MHLGSDHQHRWGVILAGGEGARLKSLTRFVSGEDTPETILPAAGRPISVGANHASALAGRSAPERTVYVLLNSHERFYNKELRNGVPSR